MFYGLSTNPTLLGVYYTNYHGDNVLGHNQLSVRNRPVMCVQGLLWQYRYLATHPIWALHARPLIIRLWPCNSDSQSPLAPNMETRQLARIDPCSSRTRSRLSSRHKTPCSSQREQTLLDPSMSRGC